MASKLLKSLQKSGYETLAESRIIQARPPLRTSVPVLNLALSGSFNGGLEAGTTILAGPSSSFKTGLLLYFMREFQKNYPEGVIIMVDSEGGTNPQMLSNFGINIDKVIYIAVTNIGEMHHVIQTVLQEHVTPDDHVFLGVDSIGNIATAGEVERALNNKISADLGNRAKELKSLFRTISPYIRDNGVYAVFLNHTYDTPEMFSKRVMSGGSGPQYDAQTTIFLNKVKNPNAVHQGDNRFNILVEKSRKVVDKSKFYLDVYQGRGIDPLSCLADLAKDKKIGVLAHHAGQHWKLFDIDPETGELTEESITKKDLDSLEFWARIITQNKLFNKAIEENYLVRIDEEFAEASDDIFSLIDKGESKDVKEDKKPSDNEKGTKGKS